jgi:hypothetical protein
VPGWEDVRELALRFPGTEESTSYGTPAIRARKALLARLRDDDGTLVLRVDFEERLALVHEQPRIFFVTPHYDDYPFVLVRLAAVDRDELAELLEEAWRAVAPKRVVAAYDGGAGTP